MSQLSFGVTVRPGHGGLSIPQRALSWSRSDHGSDGTREDQRGTKSQRNWGKWSGSWVGMWRGLKALLVFGSWLDGGDTQGIIIIIYNPWAGNAYHKPPPMVLWSSLVFSYLWISLGRHEETKPWTSNFGVQVLGYSGPPAPCQSWCIKVSRMSSQVLRSLTMALFGMTCNNYINTIGETPFHPLIIHMSNVQSH